MRSSRGSRSRTSQRRKLVWARSTVKATTAATAASPALAAPIRVDALAAFQTQLGARLPGYTVARIRGRAGTVGNSTTSLQTVMFNAWIGSVNDVVRGPNANDNYYDVTSMNRDYFMVEPFVSPVAANTQLFGNDVIHRLVDIRSSRKIEELDQTLIFDISGTSTAGADSFTFAYDLSILLMLP